jgi:hypothetical protein
MPRSSVPAGSAEPGLKPFPQDGRAEGVCRTLAWRHLAPQRERCLARSPGNNRQQIPYKSCYLAARRRLQDLSPRAAPVPKTGARVPQREAPVPPKSHAGSTDFPGCQFGIASLLRLYRLQALLPTRRECLC